MPTNVAASMVAVACAAETAGLTPSRQPSIHAGQWAPIGAGPRPAAARPFSTEHRQLVAGRGRLTRLRGGGQAF